MTLRTTLASLAAAAAITGLAAAPSLAAPLSATSAGARAATDSQMTNVQYRGRAYSHRRWHSHNRGVAPFVAGALVGAATAPLWAFGGPAYGYGYHYGYADPGYGYYGYAGPAYRYGYRRSCVIDDGYGRTRPCSNGNS